MVDKTVPIQLGVFDLAGTTVRDEGGVVLSSFILAARLHGLSDDPDELNALMGMDKREAFRILANRRYPDSSATAEEVAGAGLATFISRIRDEYERDLAPVPGAEETFVFLRARGIKIAIDTGFDADIGGMIVAKLGWLGRLVDFAVFSTDVPRGRPAPFMIFRAMERLDVHNVRRVMKIGDSPVDLEEGYNAGCGEVIGVLGGAHSRATLERYPHTRLIQSVAELPTLFPQLEPAQ
jgi:phosphonatase-like hydrolase